MEWWGGLRVDRPPPGTVGSSWLLRLFLQLQHRSWLLLLIGAGDHTTHTRGIGEFNLHAPLLCTNLCSSAEWQWWGCWRRQWRCLGNRLFQLEPKRPGHLKTFLRISQHRPFRVQSVTVIHSSSSVWVFEHSEAQPSPPTAYRITARWATSLAQRLQRDTDTGWTLHKCGHHNIVDKTIFVVQWKTLVHPHPVI